MKTDAGRFIRSNTTLTASPLVPEIRLFLANELTPIWQASEAWFAEHNVDPPFWAFAWPGGQALARHILDNPHLVAGRRVLDFAAGCGVAGIACARAGAKHVEAAEIDPLAVVAIGLNAAANDVHVQTVGTDIVGVQCQWDLILCGDVCYEAPMTRRIMPWLQDMADAAELWLADPGRSYLPTQGLVPFARYKVLTSHEIEDCSERDVVIYRLAR